MFRYKRLMFGWNSAPEIFQKTIERLLAHCKNCLIHIEDIIVFGTRKKEQDVCLQAVLKVCDENNVLLNGENAWKVYVKFIFLVVGKRHWSRPNQSENYKRIQDAKH